MLRKGESGFSVIELLIVMAAIGLLLGMGAQFLNIQTSVVSEQTMQSKMDTIQIALKNYREKVGNLPCPAPGVSAPGAADYGVAETDCRTTCPSGLTCTVDAAIGTLPYVTLGIPKELAQDSHDRKISYAVDRKFTVGKCEVNGAIIVNDRNDNAVTTAAMYVIISHGADGNGSFSTAGGAKSSCITTRSDGENCDDDGTFRVNVINETNTTTHYDDIISWDVNSEVLHSPASVFDSRLWLDAADKCTVTVDGSNNVSEWLDKSKNAYVAIQSSSPSRPNYVDSGANMINGNPIIDFGGSHLLPIAGIGDLPETNYTQFLVFKTADSNAAITAATNGDTYSATSDRRFGIRNSGKMAHFLQGGSQTESTGNFNDDIAHIAVVKVESGTGETMYVDGNQVATSAQDQSTFTGQSHFVIGGNSSWDFYTGDVLEIIIFDKVLTDNERTLVENYLSDKWDIDISSQTAASSGGNTPSLGGVKTFGSRTKTFRKIS